MILYNLLTNRIENISYIENNGIKYVSKITEQELNADKYYKVNYGEKPNRRYYSFIESKELLDNIYQISYVSVDNDIDVMCTVMLKDLSIYFKEISERPRVDTGLGYFVDGSRLDKENFITGQKYSLPTIKDADGIFQDVTNEDYNIIIQKIEENGLYLYQTKWTKEQEILALTTITECVLYENTPYEDIVELTDEDGVLTGETETITLYKNLVKTF